jgi:putative transposase
VGKDLITIKHSIPGQATLIEHIAELREAVRMVREKQPFHIDAWVVLPDHRHAIWTLPAGDDQYSNRWRAIKKAFSKTIPKTEYRSAIRIKRSERGIWQRRFWEHTILDDADYAAHKDYIHHKPVKHGWAVAVKGWPYSSFLRLVKMDIYPLTWTWLDLALLEPGEPDN